MKRLMIMLMLTGHVYISHAQRGQRSPKQGNMEERIERAKEELKLSDEQVESWRAVHEKYQPELKAARDARDREKGKSTLDKMDGELKAILTEEQQQTFEEMKKKRRKRGRGR